MDDNNVAILDWPARSPDLNPIENVWGSMVQNIYKNGSSFKNKEDLKEETVFTCIEYLK